MREELSLTQVAARLDVPVEIVRAWIAVGHVRATQAPTGWWRVPRAEVARLLRMLPDGRAA